MGEYTYHPVCDPTPKPLEAWWQEPSVPYIPTEEEQEMLLREEAKFIREFEDFE